MSQTLKQGALDKMLAYAAVPIIEPHGNNDGPTYNKAQRLFDLREGTATVKGDPTCAVIPCMTFAIAWSVQHGLDPTDEALLKHTALPALRRVMPISAGALDMLTQAQDTFGTYLHPSQWQHVEEGDGIVYEFAPGEHHFGIVRAKVEWVRKGNLLVPTKVPTVEANTMPQDGVSETNDAGRNGGIFTKRRNFAPGYHYRILGFIQMPK